MQKLSPNKHIWMIHNSTVFLMVQSLNMRTYSWSLPPESQQKYRKNIARFNNISNIISLLYIWHRAGPESISLKVIYHPLHGMNNYVLMWGDWLSCDPLRGSHDSQSPHIWGNWLSCDSLRGSHDSQSPHIRKHLCPILWQLWFICHKFLHTI